ncbi:SDR family NAD(P)-dependent oxidoreductase [Microbacterium caowuchunii]|uniref:SDR family NAD(P)-dependent oxidoreductase n=1 Tax=Microbacterium caowuchunii TaxID=2614638 RepID=UPI001244F99A|nr:SDR family NAD(P)-dependent oxidoreductase [Microbacterium caowuchunii]
MRRSSRARYSSSTPKPSPTSSSSIPTTSSHRILTVCPAAVVIRARPCRLRGCPSAVRDPAIIAAGGGATVNTSSILGVVGEPTAAPYAAAKHGVAGMTKSARAAYAAQGVRINSVHPGYMDTPSWRRSRERRTTPSCRSI